MKPEKIKVAEVCRLGRKLTFSQGFIGYWAKRRTFDHYFVCGRISDPDKCKHTCLVRCVECDQLPEKT